jgi:glycosyltransferase involved in cell wall biosynthesis
LPPTPEVSVVIPTRDRPDLVARAVRSALAQTMDRLEVIVVVDGPDEHTCAALAEIEDARLRVIELPDQGGAPNARNVGAGVAQARWTAFLDDDDEWVTTKLAAQLEIAERSPLPLPIVVSRLINRTPRVDFVVPRRLPGPGEPISEYLAVRRGLFHGDGFIQTSTIMAPTDLVRRVPFAVGLRRLQELDWTLRALRQEGTGVLMAAEPLVIWHTDEDRPRVSFDAPWQQSLDWIKASRQNFTPRAYAALMMSVISAMAAPTHNVRVFWTLLREAHTYGRPGLVDYLTYLQVWLLPQGLRRAVRDLALGRRDRARGQIGAE